MLVRGVIAWTQLFGMISFELFGQFVGSFEPADALFAHAVVQLAAFVGLALSRPRRSTEYADNRANARSRQCDSRRTGAATLEA